MKAQLKSSDHCHVFVDHYDQRSASSVYNGAMYISF